MIFPAPKCIQKKIRNSLNGKDKELSKVVMEEYANGKKYYFLVPKDPDDYVDLYDEDCNILCVQASINMEGANNNCNFNASIFLRKRIIWQAD